MRGDDVYFVLLNKFANFKYLEDVINSFEIKLSASTGDARRLIDGGGVKINGEALAPKSYNVDPDLLDHAILQAGKRRFAKLV